MGIRGLWASAVTLHLKLLAKPSGSEEDRSRLTIRLLTCREEGFGLFLWFRLQAHVILETQNQQLQPRLVVICSPFGPVIGVDSTGTNDQTPPLCARATLKSPGQKAVCFVVYVRSSIASTYFLPPREQGRR